MGLVLCACWFDDFVQISNLTQSVASMETQLRQQSEQKLRAEADLMTIRDLCVKLDQQKDALLEQLGDKNASKAHVNSLTSRLVCFLFPLFLRYMCCLTKVFSRSRAVRGAAIQAEGRA